MFGNFFENGLQRHFYPQNANELQPDSAEHLFNVSKLKEKSKQCIITHNAAFLFFAGAGECGERYVLFNLSRCDHTKRIMNGRLSALLLSTGHNS